MDEKILLRRGKIVAFLIVPIMFLCMAGGYCVYLQYFCENEDKWGGFVGHEVNAFIKASPLLLVSILCCVYGFSHYSRDLRSRKMILFSFLVAFTLQFLLIVYWRTHNLVTRIACNETHRPDGTITRWYDFWHKQSVRNGDDLISWRRDGRLLLERRNGIVLHENNYFSNGDLHYERYREMLPSGMERWGSRFYRRGQILNTEDIGTYGNDGKFIHRDRKLYDKDGQLFRHIVDKASGESVLYTVYDQAGNEIKFGVRDPREFRFLGDRH